jgi:hypothetical protein
MVVWPTLMCATEPGLARARLYRPTQRKETAGPVWVGSLEDFALNAEDGARLWSAPEERTGQTWSMD